MRDRWLGRRVLRRLPSLVVGLLLFGTAIALMVRADLGLSPWETFHQGLSRQTGVPIGTISILLGVPILLLWIPLGARPGIGTALNVVIVGVSTNVLLAALPQPTGLAIQLLYFGLGLGAVAIGSGMYLATDLGAGPRDGLFTAVHQRTGWRIAYVRTAIEGSVLLAGFILGGTVGAGTLAFALVIGHLTEWSLGVFDKEGRIMRRRVRQEIEPVPEGAA